jgi:hypothetical protein
VIENSVFYYFGVTGVGVQGFVFGKQALYCLNHICSPFLLWLFWRGSLAKRLPGLALNLNLHNLSQVSGITGMSPLAPSVSCILNLCF